MRIVTRIRLFLSAAALLPLLTACLGRATPPELVKLTQAQNEVLGKFARQVGEKELNILLKDPNDTTLPGIPIGDLLYILSKVNEDKLIRLVKGITATTTLELILAIKRVGCTRANTVPIASGYGFDARSVTSLNGCTWQHLHIPNLMVQILNGVSDQGLQVLIDSIRHNYPEYGLPANRALQISCPIATCPSLHVAPYLVTVDHYRYLMKLAYIFVGFDTPTVADPNLAGPNLVGPKKLYDLLNLTYDGRDMVFLLDSFDRNNCPVLPSTSSNCVYVDTANNLTTYDTSGDLWKDIAVNNHQLQGLQNLLSIINGVTDTSKMGVLVNGRRTQNPTSIAARLADDEAQIRYFIDRLRVVIERTTTCTAASYPGTAAEQALQDFANPQGGSGVWNAKLAEIINRVNNIDRMMDLIYGIDDGFDLNHVSVFGCPGRGLDNLMVLINNVNSVDAHVNDLTGYNPPYTNLTANTVNNELITVAYLIDNAVLDPLNNNPAKRNKVKYLIEYLGDTRAVLQLACYTAVADNNPVGAGTCANRGLINQVADGSKLSDASAVDLTAAGQKLVNLMGTCLPGLCATDGVHDIEDMRFIIRNVSMANLSGMLKGLLISATQRTASLINQITGNDCWGEAAGLIGTTVTFPGPAHAYTSPPTVTVAAPPSSVNTNLNFPPAVMAAGTTAVVKAVIETDAVNFAATVGQLKDLVIIDSGSGYYTTVPSFMLVPPALTIPGPATATAIVGSCSYNKPLGGEFRGIPTAAGTSATGLGKLVNVINHITGSPGTLVTLINGVTDGAKLGILINGVTRSSNLVGIVNATVDASRNNNATINDLISLMNSLSHEDVYKLVHIIENLGDAREVDAQVTVPGGDHDMVAQLMAPYNAANINTTSGIGVPALTELVAMLRYDGGNELPVGINTITISGGGGAGASATFERTTPGVVSAIELTSYGSGCTAAPVVNIAGTGGATATAILDSGAQQVSRIRIDNPGSGYATAPAVTFTGGCTVQPVGVAKINRVGAITITNPGSGYTDNPVPGPSTCSAGGVNLTCQVSGAISSLDNFYGGSGYSTGDVCPITGAGGKGATCTVIASGGSLVGCSAIGGDIGFPAGGINYGDERIVKIGGRAEAVVTVVGGVVTAINVTNTGCGYVAVPTIEVVGCAVAPTFNVTIPGGRVNATVATGGSGCPVGAKVVIGENPFVAFADGASAIVDTIAGGRLTFVSVSEPSVNAAQLIQLIDRDATGITSGTRGFSITYNGTAPSISAREAMVRLLHHGVTIPAGSAKGYFSEGFGLGSVVDVVSDGLSDNLKSGVALGGAGVWTNAYAVNLPGLGPRHIAGSILNELKDVKPTQTLINMMNTNTVDLTDTLLLLGCGDRSTYTNSAVTAFTWQELCTQLGPGLW